MLFAAFWLLLTILTALAGPFGTHDALSLPGRFAYWGLVVGLSLLASLLPERVTPHGGWAYVAAWAVYALCISLLVLILNRLTFGGWSDPPSFAYLAAIVGSTVLVVHGLIRLALATRSAPQTPAEPPEARFLRRLPFERRAPLVRLEAQDHYLKVVTAKGESLILLRMGEAVEELSGVPGLQVHRSHWVALEGVTAHRREKGKDLLLMVDGTEVPVSRGNREAAREAGLI
ncbi:MAG: LytTR family DNA-binding domain-containing protein [Sulfitobacter sp.]|nr:LytTR family DNA-binding domain-containing protein [Sulfitobacter sp.]